MSEDESYLVRPKDLLEIVQSQDRGALAQFLSDPRSAIAGALIETFSHGPGAFTGSLVKIGIAALSGRALQQFAQEIKDFQAKGKIAEDWAEKPKGYQTWVELLRVIDEESPDEERLDAMKALFFAVNRITATDGERILAYQLFQIAKELNSNELLTLKACYQLHEEGRLSGIAELPTFWNNVSAYSGHSIVGLAQLADKVLSEQQLIQNARLTGLGLKFCENIQQYQIDKKS